MRSSMLVLCNKLHIFANAKLSPLRPSHRPNASSKHSLGNNNYFEHLLKTDTPDAQPQASLVYTHTVKSVFLCNCMSVCADVC